MIHLDSPSPPLPQAIHEHFQGYNIPDEQLESETYLGIQDRLRMENSRTDLLHSIGTS